IKNLSEQGARHSCQIEVTEQNFPMIDKIVHLARSAHKVILSFPNHGDNFEKTAAPFHEISDAMERARIHPMMFLQGMPMCFTKGNTTYASTNHKSQKCISCVHQGLCAGLTEKYLELFTDEFLRPEPDLPKEVAIEITEECNLECNFCFKKNISYSKGNLTLDEFTQIVSRIPKGVDHIRITGGEPLMHAEFEKMLKVCKDAGKKIWLNTNATLVNERNAEIIARHVENVLVPLVASDREKEKESTGKDSYEARIKGILLLKKHGAKNVRCGTVATRQNIQNLEMIYSLALNMGLSDWEVYRQMPTPDETEPTSSDDIHLMLKKLNNLNRIFNKKYKVVNALPFCAVNHQHITDLCAGAIADDGHMRFVISPDGKARPSYFLDVDVGDAFGQSVEEIWKSKFMKDLRNLELVPEECRDCLHAVKCKGGSRFASKKSTGSYDGKDPLANFANIMW
ncbi:MAG: radical SAM protein, partial [Candidatus Woesearchaeota archaeon]